ncbi:unnamed protein product [Spirodela intermedia]|uniref:RING-type E3 ubiquitin transferase n=1 Tax=Spirodela intermedia TaxID=51605 RepID=A0A7I8JPJ8_SPIIN|nr:unnamed protein product [Spirodela intermedia]CAA6672108.1 unnamed protein product [Spirodela intermedia]
MLGTKSDIYSFGVILLQLITGQPPIGLAHRVERAIEEGAFEGMLDPAVHDWPLKEALSLAKMAVKCAELRRKDRPDLSTVLLPELNRLRAMAEESLHRGVLGRADLADDDTQTCISNVSREDPPILLTPPPS